MTDLVVLEERAIQIGCVGSKTCPISSAPCPGQCIFADVMASVGLGIIVFDQNGRSILFANPWSRRLFDRVRVPVEFDVLEQLLLRHEAGGGDPVDGRAQQIRLGSRFLGFTVYSARGFAWVFVRDITEKARLESIAAAVETTNNIGYVFSAVRHELGNPINSIKVALGVLEANLGTYSRETIADYVSRMATEVTRIERLLRSLRSFSLYERPEVVRVELSTFLREFCGLVRPELEARGIRMESHVASSVVAHCDPRALHQVLLNLVTNAADALAGRDDACVTLRCVCSDSLATVRLEDNGVGISEDQKAELFKPFNTTKAHGTGLGLVIVRKLLAAMGATIAIDSTLGVGTSVSIAIPTSNPCCTVPSS
ncbi:MAG: HAMP domain-containing histidine kinase [Deltaproteobacteria bacterium]|nr:HAMP domain-containing histidine kinase [Deltaproteobacteria bacterium]